MTKMSSKQKQAQALVHKIDVLIAKAKTHLGIFENIPDKDLMLMSDAEVLRRIDDCRYEGQLRAYKQAHGCLRKMFMWLSDLEALDNVVILKDMVRCAPGPDLINKAFELLPAVCFHPGDCQPGLGHSEKRDQTFAMLGLLFQWASDLRQSGSPETLRWMMEKMPEPDVMSRTMDVLRRQESIPL